MKEGYRTKFLSFNKRDINSTHDFQLNVEMEPVGHLVTIIGTVTSSSSKPVFNAKVQINSLFLNRRFQASTDHSGNFIIEGVEVADDYQLWR